MARKKRPIRNWEEWEDSEAKKDLKHRIEKLRSEELENPDDYADFDPMPYYERDETIGEE